MRYQSQHFIIEKMRGVIAGKNAIFPARAMNQPQRFQKALKQLAAATIFTLVLFFGALWFSPETYFGLFETPVSQARQVGTGQIQASQAKTPEGRAAQTPSSQVPDGSTVATAADSTATPISPAPSPAGTGMSIPSQDPSLPQGNWLIIPTLGINGQLHEAALESSEDAMRQGIWRVPDFGQPGDTAKPMILAAHRWGYDWWWKNDYGTRNSFKRLPELKVGERVEVITDQRRFIYEVYQAEEGTEITDYRADLILYTCKFWNAKERYFRYLRRVQAS